MENPEVIQPGDRVRTITKRRGTFLYLEPKPDGITMVDVTLDTEPTPTPSGLARGMARVKHVYASDRRDASRANCWRRAVIVIPMRALGVAVAVVVLYAPGASSAAGSLPTRHLPGPNGTSYSVLRDGETRHEVLALLGRGYSVCTTCARRTLIYPTGLDDPVAIVVRFRHGVLASHFLIRVKIAE